ncbi:MAG TPA: glycosyltransferase 87 family protein [Actinomycetota bacterium]|nr:glycosyltransferase 87 family protein [Actinomycetota bacterium]
MDSSGRASITTTKPAGAITAIAPIVACLVTLGAGFALKGQCLDPWTDFHQYESLCYNDLQPLWSARGIAERTFPYVSGSIERGELADGAIEYPVLTGVFMWASGAFARTSNAYLVHSALLLAPFGVLVAWLLGRLTGLRSLLWAAAPALALYAFHNWDLLVVAATVCGLYLWLAGRPVGAGVSFGIGGALKLYPLAFLVPVFLALVAAGRRRTASYVAAAGLGTFAVINLPFVLANFSGWWATFEFHRARGPNFDNIWSIRDWGPISLPTLSPGRLNLVTAVLTAVFVLAALAVGWSRARRSGHFPVLEVCAALLAAFLLWNKVHSPQYALWLLPFFVLTRVHIGWWAAYTVADLATYIGTFRFFFDVCSDEGCVVGDPTVAQHLMNAGVFIRAGLLLTLFFVFLREKTGGDPSSRPVVSHPSATLASVGEGATQPD